MDTEEGLNLKILHIIDSGGLYGAEMVLLNLVAEQIKMGLEPVIASIGEKGITEKPIEAEALKRGFKVRKFRMKPGPNVLGAFEILRYACRNNFALLHSHGYKGDIFFGFMPKIIRKMPIVTTLHGWTSTNGFGKMGLYEWLDAKSLKFIDAVVLVSEGMLSSPRLKKVQGVKFHVVNNGISFSGTPPTQACQKIKRTQSTQQAHITQLTQGTQVTIYQRIIDFCAKSFTIVSVGRLSPEKGLGFLLEAIAGLVEEGRDVRLAILGDGSLRCELEQNARTLRIADRVLFLGYVRSAKDYLGSFNLFCMPSLTEGLPMVLLEAMAARVPVIATRVGGIPGILDFGRAGLLIEAGRVDALREAIVECMDRHHLVQGRTEAGAWRVQQMYSSRAMAEKYLRVYKEILQKSASFQ